MRKHYLNSNARESYIDFLNEKFKDNKIDFKQLINAYTSMRAVNKRNDSYLWRLLENKEFFEELIQNNKLNKEDLKYLLNTVDKWYELRNLCINTPLIKKILNEFVLNKEDVDRFDTMIENNDWYKAHNIHTIFDLIKDWNKSNEEMLKLNDLNRKVYLVNSFDLNEDQKLDLIEVLKNNEVAGNRLKDIVDNHLENNYDFESLMRYLKKREKKNLINI